MQVCEDCGLQADSSLKFNVSTCKPCIRKRAQVYQQYRSQRAAWPQIQQVLEYLYIGNEDGAGDWQQLKIRDIRSILVVGYELVMPFQQKGIQYLWFQIDDCPQVDIQLLFDKGYRFIQENKGKGAVLVHCAAGVSRSATIVIAYLMRKFAWKFEKALLFLKSKRKQIRPNLGFKEKLIKFEETMADRFQTQ